MAEQESHGCAPSACSSCPSAAGCASNATQEKQTGGGPFAEFRVPTHEMNVIRHVIGVVSGKGGVGKSMMTSLLAVDMRRRGFNVGILDADVTGPSIPQAFGIHDKASNTEMGLMPVMTKTGIRVMSLNLLLDDATDPVVWRGPVISGAVQQFWSDVIWGDLDYLFVDMPPGTGDVTLTVFQSLPLDGIVVVTSPQDLVSQVVLKAVKMARMMDVPILGLVENMSYLSCPDCGKEISVFGESRLEQHAKEWDIDITARVPIDPKLTAAVDQGVAERYEGDWLKDIDTIMAELPENRELSQE